MKRLFAHALLGFAFGAAALPHALAQQRPLVLVSFDYPPYVEVQPGQPATGMMVDLVNTIFARMRQPVELQFYPLARSLSLIDTPRASG